jgi:outer membrane protein insertion porin family
MEDVEKDWLYEHPHDDEPRRLLREQEDKYGDSWEIPFVVFWRNDTRDEFLFPKRGYLFNVHGDIVGGDNSYWRTGFRYRHYWTAVKKWGHVLQWGLRGETLDDFSGGLPIYDRLFLGGSRSIRGVDFREIAPRVYAREGKHGKYIAWGGRSSWCMNMEYSIPVIAIVRLAAFSDLGSVGEDSFDVDMDWFCWSVGIGLRLDLEQFPMRLDFAVPVVDPDEDVDEKVFSFSIGYDF